MKRIRISVCAALLLLTASLSAQNVPVVTEIEANENYLVTVLIGVMLAIGFQFLLTSLATAIGLTATPNLKETWAHSKYSSSEDDEKNWNDHSEGTNIGVLVSTGLGVFNVITACLSLFGATALALTLTHVVTPAISITLALAIWAIFYLLMYYFEGRLFGTLIGGLIGTATSGLKAGAESIKQIVTPSPAGQIQNVADNTIEKLRKEMTSAFDNSEVSNTVDRFLDRVENDLPSYDKLKADLKEIAQSGNSGGGGNPATWTALQGVVNKAIDENGGDQAKNDKIAKLKNLVKELQEEAKSDSTNMGTYGASQQGGGTQKYLDKLTDYVQNATPDSFDAEKLRTQLTEFANDPQGNTANLREELKGLDKNKVVDLISQNTSLEKSQVENYANQVTGILQTIQEKLPTGGGSGSGGGAMIKPGDVAKRAESSIANFVNSTDDPRLNYADLKRDFQAILNNPGDTLDIVRARLNNYDRDTLISVLTNNPRINRSDINRIADQVESSRNDVLQQVQTIQDKALATAKQVERRAVIQAEHARKAAVAASWWLFTSIVASAVAAILGAEATIF